MSEIWPPAHSSNWKYGFPLGVQNETTASRSEFRQTTTSRSEFYLKPVALGFKFWRSVEEGSFLKFSFSLELTTKVSWFRGREYCEEKEKIISCCMGIQLSYSYNSVPCVNVPSTYALMELVEEKQGFYSYNSVPNGYCSINLSILCTHYRQSLFSFVLLWKVKNNI
jgi:hypothetical protein